MHNHEHVPPFARTFTKLKVQFNEPRAGFDMFIAVWCEGPTTGEVIIGAPTLDLLAERWERITRLKLDSKRAQHVIVSYCTAPDELWAQAKAAAESQPAGEPVFND